MQPAIEHVSDTALLVAACRALETENPDGFVNDPFAARLAGDRGMAIAKSMESVFWLGFAIGMRSVFVDELLRIALQHGIDTVLNLGAGLDTRPWRLDLHLELRWIEVDFPAMLDYKHSLLADAEPRCRLERMSADLSNPAERATALQRASGGNALLMTEGLLMYLPADAIHSLAREAHDDRTFRFWLLDGTSTALMERMHGDMSNSFNRVRAASHLDGTESRAAVESAGWRPFAHRTYVTDGAALGQQRAAKAIAAAAIRPEQLPPPPKEDGSGVWLYQSGR